MRRGVCGKHLRAYGASLFAHTGVKFVPHNTPVSLSKQKPSFTAIAKIAHAGIKRQGYINGPLCPLFSGWPALDI